jgi:hypothetical protein
MEKGRHILRNRVFLLAGGALRESGFPVVDRHFRPVGVQPSDHLVACLPDNFPDVPPVNQ